jgi:hypothetical protein
MEGGREKGKSGPAKLGFQWDGFTAHGQSFSPTPSLPMGGLIAYCRSLATKLPNCAANMRVCVNHAPAPQRQTSCARAFSHPFRIAHCPQPALSGSSVSLRKTLTVPQPVFCRHTLGSKSGSRVVGHLPASSRCRSSRPKDSGIQMMQ